MTTVTPHTDIREVHRRKALELLTRAEVWLETTDDNHHALALVGMAEVHALLARP